MATHNVISIVDPYIFVLTQSAYTRITLCTSCIFFLIFLDEEQYNIQQ